MLISTVETAYKVYVCPRGNLLYNRLLYKRFLLYILHPEKEEEMLIIVERQEKFIPDPSFA